MDRWIDRLRARDRSEQTILRYQYFCRDFQSVCGVKASYGAGDVDKYLACLRERKLSQNYLKFAYYCLQSLYSFAEWKFPFKRGEMRWRTESPNKFYTFEEMMKVIAAARDSERDQAILWILWVTGCRRGDIVELRRRDHDFKKGEIRIPNVKAGRPVQWKLPGNVNVLLEKLVGKEWLFSEGDKKLHPNTINAIVERWSVRAGVESKGPHSIRRGRSTYLFSKLGMREREVQEAMGWQTPQMVMRYIKLLPGEAHNKIVEKDPLYGVK